MRKEHLVICFLAVLSLTLIAYAPATTSPQPEYDPWADINDDGIIDIYDLVYGAARYGATGDPTKPVEVTNWPLDEYGSLKVRETRIFERPLVLEGIELDELLYFGIEPFGTLIPFYLSKGMLIDRYTPIPNGARLYQERSTTSTSWSCISNTSYTYWIYPAEPYHIYGKLIVNFEMAVKVDGGYGEFRVTIYLEKIDGNGTVTTIASKLMFHESTTSTSWVEIKRASSMSIPYTTIERGELISIRVLVEARNSDGYKSWFRHYLSIPSHPYVFTVTIPLTN